MALMALITGDLPGVNRERLTRIAVKPKSPTPGGDTEVGHWQRVAQLPHGQSQTFVRQGTTLVR